MNKKVKVLSFVVVGVIAVGAFAGFHVDMSNLMTKVIQTKVVKDLPVTRADVAAAIAGYVITEDEDLGDFETCALNDEDLPDDMSSICYVIDQGIMLTDADGYFNPSESMTRAEAARYFSVAHDYLVDNEILDSVDVPDVCTTAVKKGSTKKTTTCMYKDVKNVDNFSYDVANLVMNGISDVKAYKGKSFNPSKTFTQSQFKIWDKNFNKLLGQ